MDGFVQVGRRQGGMKRRSPDFPRGRYETSPPKFSTPDRGRCRAASRVARTILSDAAGACSHHYPWPSLIKDQGTGMAATTWPPPLLLRAIVPLVKLLPSFGNELRKRGLGEIGMAREPRVNATNVVKTFNKIGGEIEPHTDP